MAEKSTDPSQTSRTSQAARSGAQMEVTGSKQEASVRQRSKQEASGTQRGRPSSALQTRASMAQASLSGFSPFSLVRRLMEDMDRMLEQFGSGRAFVPEAGMGQSSLQRGGLSAVWSPAVEAFERDGQFVVRADLPGLTPSGAQAKRPDGQTAVH